MNMRTNLLIGKLVRLAAQDPEKDAATIASWEQDTGYTRLLSVPPVQPPSVGARRKRLEGELEHEFYSFGVRTTAQDKLIGFVILMGVNHIHCDAWVGIGIGDPGFRGKGYGTEAMQLVLKFAFQELNLHRVSLDALATNARAVRSYEKCGFVPEGQTRGAELRDGVRDNLIFMGILRREWEAKCLSQ